jgi:hypothetical protein
MEGVNQYRLPRFFHSLMALRPSRFSAARAFITSDFTYHSRRNMGVYY